MLPAALQLVLADRGLRDAFVEMAREYSAAGEPRYEPALHDFDAYLEQARSVASRRC